MKTIGDYVGEIIFFGLLAFVAIFVLTAKISHEWGMQSRIENLKIGQIYKLDNPSPFSTSDITATIVDIKDGYVQYKLDYGTLSDCTTRTFVSVYKPIK